MNAPEQMKPHDRTLKEYDRQAEDVGNIVHLEHFNCIIDDQRLAVLFYVVGLGGTRDPYLFPGMENIWLNFGRTQVHMPSRAVPPKAERLRGTAGFVVPLSLIHISEPTRLLSISYAVFCLKKK